MCLLYMLKHGRVGRPNAQEKRRAVFAGRYVSRAAAQAYVTSDFRKLQASAEIGPR